MAVPLMVGQVYDENGKPCTVKTAAVDVAANATASTVVAAVAGKRIRVLGYAVMCGGTATTSKFNSASTQIGMTYQPPVNGGVSRNAPSGGYCFQTVAGEALTFTTGNGSTTGVEVTYCETDAA